jgi:DNA-binding beta-propeller fold protein YncE
MMTLTRAAYLASFFGFFSLFAACASTYEPVCRGEGAQQLERGELAEPSGMALANGRLYVANAASVAPAGDFDYCGSFISIFDAQTGTPVSNPLVPRDLSLPKEDQAYRFFSDITYDTKRDMLYVAERQRGGVLKVDPSNGHIVGRVATGHGPYTLLLIPNVLTGWPQDTAPVVRDILAVADIGRGGDIGHLWFVDLANFTFGGAIEVSLGRAGSPSTLRYDAATHRLFVAQFNGLGITVIDVQTLLPVDFTEPILNNYSLLIRGLALAPGNTERRLYFTSESKAFNGIWISNMDTGELLENVRLPLAPNDLDIQGNFLIGLARNRLYFMEREPLRLVHTELLGLPHPTRMLVDANNKKVYITATLPSALKIVGLP